MQTKLLTSQIQLINTIFDLPIEKGDSVMLGRVNTRQKCPVCNQKFTELPFEKGFICPEHKTLPTRYYISAKGFKCGLLYSDPQGRPLDSFIRTKRQLEIMRSDYENKKFNLCDWIPSLVAKKKFKHLSEQFLKGYFEEEKADAKATEYVQKINQVMRDYLLPEFSEMDIREINFEQIERLYHKLLNKGLAKKTIKNILNILKAFLNRYRRNDVPEFPKFTIVPKREKQWLGVERQIQITQYIPEKYQVPIELLLDTGMRTGELLALQKKDFVDGCIYVYKAISGKKLRLCRKAGGTVTYRLSLSLWQKLIDYTKEMQHDEFLFKLGSDRLYKVWIKACGHAKVKAIPLSQASRHSQASQIRQRHEIEALKEAAQQLGHSSIYTTKIYSLDMYKKVR